MTTSTAPEPEIRAFVYDTCRTRGLPPSIADTAANLDRSPAEVQAAFRRLAEDHVLVLQPNGEVLMANPFSAVPTPFSVRAGSVMAYANCIWDALGIPAMLECDAEISTSCGCCGARLHLEVAAGSVHSEADVVHFAVPARHWWDNIVFT